MTELNAAFIFGLMEALERAVQAAGGQAKLAEALGVTSMTISHWKKRGIPPKRAVQVEQALKGAVTRYELRPDIFGRVSKSPSPQAQVTP